MATMLTAAAEERPQVEADPAGEVFEILDEQGERLGQEKRGIVHAKGLWHRAVYCFVFNSSGELLLQQRSPKKKIGPRQWDLSVAEHLQPGESYYEAATRGLLEELGITGVPDEVPVADTHKRQLIIPGFYLDFEFVQSFCLTKYDGPVHFNPEEVIDVRFASLEDLKLDMHESPEKYTEWFRAEMETVKWFKN